MCLLIILSVHHHLRVSLIIYYHAIKAIRHIDDCCHSPVLIHINTLTGYGPSADATFYTSENNMSSSKETAHIAPYDGINFSLWKLGLWVLLEQHDLIGIVQGEELQPDMVYQIKKH